MMFPTGGPTRCQIMVHKNDGACSIRPQEPPTPIHLSGVVVRRGLESLTMTEVTPTIVTEELNPEHETLSISEICVSGIPTETIDEGSPARTLIHWRVQAKLAPARDETKLYLNEDGEASVVFDSARRSTDTLEVDIDVFSIDYHISRNSIAHSHFPLQKGVGLTALDMIALIKKNGLDKYKYNSAGSGCLFWCSQLVKYLEENGIIGQGSWNLLEKEIARVRKDPRWWVPDDKGEFN